jgi:hypothetical protein
MYFIYRDRRDYRSKIGWLVEKDDQAALTRFMKISQHHKLSVHAGIKFKYETNAEAGWTCTA